MMLWGSFLKQSKISIEILFRLGERCQAISRDKYFWKKKCAWRSEHETKICANFHRKAARVLASLLMKARKNNKNPRWILSEDWDKLLAHWANDPRFKQMSEIGKKARSSTNDGSLHTSGAQREIGKGTRKTGNSG